MAPILELWQPGGMKILETRRLVLRSLHLEDAEFILDLLNQESFLRNIGDKKVRNLEDARGYLSDGPMAMYARHGHGLWAVDLKTTGATIGICGLLKREEMEDVDLGLALLPQYWRQGYAHEAAAATLEYGRTTLGLPRIAAITAMDNTASVGLVGKLGMHEQEPIAFGDHDEPSRFFIISFE